MLLDSNIIIYSFQSQFQNLQSLMESNSTYCSAVTLIETLGYHELSEEEKFYLERLFEIIYVLPVTQNIIKRAISLRQKKKMTLGDSIIAATALEHQQTLVTRNTEDFNWIEELKIINPVN